MSSTSCLPVPNSELISSAGNQLAKRLRRLSQRKYRRAEGACVVEGIQPVRQAHEAGWRIDTLVVAPELLRAQSAQAFVADVEASGTSVARLTAELFGRLSDRDGPTGLAAIIDTSVRSEVPPAAASETWVAVERLGNPGNLGTILRTADATGAAGMILVGPTADPWDPASIKASMGAVFSVPLLQVDDLAELRTWIAARDGQLVTTAARAEHSLWEVEFADRVVLLLGSEQEGLDDQTLGRGDLAVNIPMTGTAESLNLAQAATVLLYEVWRQRTV